MGASVACYPRRRGMTDVVLVGARRCSPTGSDRPKRGRRAPSVFQRRRTSASPSNRSAVLERFGDETGQPIDFPSGRLPFLLSTQAASRPSAGTVALQRSLGVDVEWLDAPDAARLRRACARRRGRRDVLPARTGMPTPTA